MSIRGVSFVINSECNETLSKVLSGIDVGKYNWYIDQDQTEGWILNTNTDFFEYSFYTGDLLNKIIQKPVKWSLGSNANKNEIPVSLLRSPGSHICP